MEEAALWFGGRRVDNGGGWLATEVECGYANSATCAHLADDKGFQVAYGIIAYERSWRV